MIKQQSEEKSSDGSLILNVNILDGGDMESILSLIQENRSKYSEFRIGLPAEGLEYEPSDLRSLSMEKHGAVVEVYFQADPAAHSKKKIANNLNDPRILSFISEDYYENIVVMGDITTFARVGYEGDADYHACDTPRPWTRHSTTRNGYWSCETDRYFTAAKKILIRGPEVPATIMHDIPWKMMANLNVIHIKDTGFASDAILPLCQDSRFPKPHTLILENNENMTGNALNVLYCSLEDGIISSLENLSIKGMEIENVGNILPYFFPRLKRIMLSNVTAYRSRFAFHVLYRIAEIPNIKEIVLVDSFHELNQETKLECVSDALRNSEREMDHDVTLWIQDGDNSMRRMMIG